jgi:hypothetical protein
MASPTHATRKYCQSVIWPHSNTDIRTSRFKEFLKKQGLNYENGQISALNKVGDGSTAATAPKTPTKKKASNGNERKKTGATGKRNVAEMEDDEVEVKEGADAKDEDED